MVGRGSGRRVMTTTHKTSRRTLLAGGTALAAGAVANCTAIVSAYPAIADPILDAIERHRLAWFKQAASGRIKCNLNDDTPEHREAEESETAAREALNDASFALLDTMPTTCAGMVSLLMYVEQFNRGDFA